MNSRQKAFADEYIKNGGNARQAALAAGYSENTAKDAGRKILEKSGVLEYIAERQAEIEKEKGRDIMSLTDIQVMRSKIARGEVTDSFGFAPDFADRNKAMSELEKALNIKAAEEERKRKAEEALKAKTYHMDLDDIPDTFHATIRDIRNHRHLEYDFKGGRGSTKSSSIAMMIVELMRNFHNIHVVVCRQVGNTLKDSVYNKLQWAIDKQGLSEEFRFQKSPMEIVLKATGQTIYFRGADDPDKIKSINPPFGYIGILWFEELDQFEGPEAVRKIEQSAIRGGDIAWIFKSFNPPKSMNNWANEYIQEPKENRIVHHSTYHDVEPSWLGKAFLEEAEHLKAINPDAYEHEYGGVANGVGGKVFEYLEIREITDEEIEAMDHLYAGVDWGWYPDPYAFILCSYNPRNEKIYLLDENVGCKKSNEKTAAWILKHHKQDLHDMQYGVICDSEENKSVVDYTNLGIWNAKPAYKPPGSVEYSMKWLQRRTLVIDPKRTPYACKEIKKYEYDRDKEGNIISGYPDRDNHTIDALRYSLSPVYLRRQSKA